MVIDRIPVVAHFAIQKRSENDAEVNIVDIIYIVDANFIRINSLVIGTLAAHIVFVVVIKLQKEINN